MLSTQPILPARVTRDDVPSKDVNESRRTSYLESAWFKQQLKQQHNISSKYNGMNNAAPLATPAYTGTDDQ